MADTASCGVRRGGSHGSIPCSRLVSAPVHRHNLFRRPRSIFGMRGRFVIALPVSVLELHSNLFALKRPPIDRPKSQLVIAIVTLKNRTLSPTTQLFIACAREVTKPLRKGKG